MRNNKVDNFVTAKTKSLQIISLTTMSPVRSFFYKLNSFLHKMSINL